MKINIEQVTAKMSNYQILEVGQRTGFEKRKSRKINCQNFTLGFFETLCEDSFSYRKWALHLSQFISGTVSKQAILKRLRKGDEAFAREMLSHILKEDLQRQSKGVLTCELFKSFNEVLLEDSTCVALPAWLAEYFPGSYSHKGSCATARIQLRINLLSESYSRIELQSYRDNDQKFAGDIVETLAAGDLVIRDLGYWSLHPLEQIVEKKPFFLSRYRYGTNLYDMQSAEPIDLHQLLRDSRRQGIQQLDKWVLLGKETKLPVRLVAIAVPENVAQSRKRKAAKDRNKKAKHSKAYMDLLDWTIFITNVPQDIWTPQQVLQAYGFRWRIEIVFKCWKGSFGLAKLFNKIGKPSKAQVSTIFYLFLAWLTLFFVRWYSFFLNAVFQSSKRMVSLFKFADFCKSRFYELLICPDLSQFLEIVGYFCIYDKRKSRPSQLELLYLTS